MKRVEIHTHLQKVFNDITSVRVLYDGSYSEVYLLTLRRKEPVSDLFLGHAKSHTDLRSYSVFINGNAPKLRIPSCQRVKSISANTQTWLFIVQKGGNRKMIVYNTVCRGYESRNETYPFHSNGPQSSMPTSGL